VEERRGRRGKGRKVEAGRGKGRVASWLMAVGDRRRWG